MSIENCIKKLVESGQVSKKAGDDALALASGMAARANAETGGATAEAIAALEVARVMAEQAQARKVSIAKQALTATKALERQAAHRKGPIAGLMGMLTRDIWETGGENVETKAQVVLGQLMKRYAPGAEAFRSRLAGLAQDTEGAWKAVGELFGVDSGSAVAREAAKGWKDAVAYGVARAQAGGKLFNVIDDWRLPQFWEPSRMKDRKADFIADVAQEARLGGVRIMDKKTGGPASQLDAARIVEQAFADITGSGGLSVASGGGAFRRDMRVFRFADGEAGFGAYRRLMEKYGTGQTIHDTMTGHLSAMAREIAFVDLLGPDYQATFRAMHRAAVAAEDAGRKSPVLVRPLESAAVAQRTFDLMTGKLSVPQSEMMAGIWGGVRAWLAASQLGSAVIPAVFGDSATAVLTSQMNGMDGMRVIRRALTDALSDPKTARMAAARMGLVAHAVSDVALSSKRFHDEMFDRDMAGKVASFVIRAQGLQAWTEGLKRAFSMEFFGYIAENAGRRFADLDEPFRNFLGRYQFTAADWDKLRQTPQIGANGARFFDLDAVEDAGLRERLMGAVLDERQFAVLEPSARVQALTTGGLQRGTFWGEMSRSLTMYKSFPIAMLATHAMRIATRSDLSTKLGYGTALLAYTSLAGAATILAKDVVAGKDPRPVNDPAFLGAAVLAGGGTGIFGDFLYQGYAKGGTIGFAAALGGPMISAAEDIAGLVFPAVRKAAEGKETDFGADLARFVKQNLPGSNIWYLRTALNRAVFDQFQMHLDPDYRTSFRRMERYAEKEYGQSYWWRPGEVTPGRAPDLGNVVR